MSQPDDPDGDGDNDGPFAALEPEDLPGQPLTAAKASALLWKEVGLPVKPSIGKTVHYVSHGTPVQPDGSQAFTSECRAAIVTEVTGDPLESAGLCVLNPGGMFFNRAVPHDEDGHSGGSWHWPERAD